MRAEQIVYWLEKRKRTRTGYPIGTIAYYGPDADRASKVVAAVLKTEEAEEAERTKKWFAEQGDLREDLAVTREIVEFFRINGVVRVAELPRIIGCPHEEGIDYPVGQSCPHCPYWENRDRWTGRSIADERSSSQEEQALLRAAVEKAKRRR